MRSWKIPVPSARKKLKLSSKPSLSEDTINFLTAYVGVLQVVRFSTNCFTARSKFMEKHRGLSTTRKITIYPFASRSHLNGSGKKQGGKCENLPHFLNFLSSWPTASLKTACCCSLDESKHIAFRRRPKCGSECRESLVGFRYIGHRLIYTYI